MRATRPALAALLLLGAHLAACTARDAEPADERARAADSAVTPPVLAPDTTGRVTATPPLVPPAATPATPARATSTPRATPARTPVRTPAESAVRIVPPPESLRAAPTGPRPPTQRPGGYIYIDSTRPRRP